MTSSTTGNPLLAKVKMPPKVFRIPSRGLLYDNGELDPSVKNGEVEVYPLSVKNEIYMKSPDLIFQGTAIDKVFRECIPQINKPLELTQYDVDYLLAALYVVSYGDSMPILWKCSCEGGATNEYQIPIAKMMAERTVELSDEVAKMYTFNLSNGQHVKCGPIKMSDLVESFQIRDIIKNMSKQSEEDIERNIAELSNSIARAGTDLSITLMSGNIRSVDGISDPELIREWVAEIPNTLKDELMDKLDKIPSWGFTDFSYTIDCVDCEGKQEDVSAVINPVYFFIQPYEMTTPKIS